MPKINGLDIGVCTLSPTSDGSHPTDMTTNVKSVDMTSPLAEIDVTTLDGDFMQRLTGLGDLTISLNGIFDPEVSHKVLRNHHRPDAAGKYHRRFIFSFGPENQTPQQRLRLQADVLITNYNVSRPESGELTWTAELTLAEGEPLWSAE